jgi:DNA-binding GntR family transcriptional regulator
MPIASKGGPGIEPGGDSSKQRASEAIFQALRMEIAFGMLRPRERLVEHDLCQRFGTSNHNIRQAFELLDRVGLVDRKANRGVEVKALTGAELQDLYEVRVLLQREGARKMDLSHGPELAAELAEINARYKAAIAADCPEDAVRANDAFHMATFDHCTNADLAALQHTYWLKASVVISRALSDRNLSQASYQDHDDMIEAIRTGNLNWLERVAVAHIQSAVDVYRRMFGLA